MPGVTVGEVFCACALVVPGNRGQCCVHVHYARGPCGQWYLQFGMFLDYGKIAIEELQGHDQRTIKAHRVREDKGREVYKNLSKLGRRMSSERRL